MNFYLPPIRPDELYHHGILGQKWGKKNGPPYPLGSSDHSSSESKAGWRNSLDKKSSKKSSKSISKEEYDKGLKEATLYGGLAGRAVYKKKHASNSNDTKISKMSQKNESSNESFQIREIPVMSQKEYHKGLKKALLVGGLIGGRKYEKNHMISDPNHRAGTTVKLIKPMKGKNRNKLINRAINYDDEFDKTSEGSKKKKLYEQQIEKLEKNENWTDKDNEEFYRIETDYLHSQAKYTGKKMVNDVSNREMQQFLARPFYSEIEYVENESAKNLVDTYVREYGDVHRY